MPAWLVFAVCFMQLLDKPRATKYLSLHSPFNSYEIDGVVHSWCSTEWACPTTVWVAKVPNFFQGQADSEDWSDWADAQAGLSLH